MSAPETDPSPSSSSLVLGEKVDGIFVLDPVGSSGDDGQYQVVHTVMFVFLAAFAGYVCTSYVLLRSPTLLYKKKEPRFPARHISHRGGAGEAAENTIVAYKRALSAGTQLLELDVHLTKDNQVVVVHDSNLRRLTGVDKSVSDFTYDELPLLEKNLAVSFARGTWMEGDKPEKIPLLKDVFDRFPKTPINIDIKIDDQRLIEETGRLISEYEREKLTVWGNSTNNITEKCYKENPEVGLLFSMKRVVHIVLMFYCGILPFVPLKETHLEIPMPSCLFQFVDKPSKRDKFILSIVDKCLMRRSLFQHLQKRGIPVYLWVLNDEAEWDRAFDELGVDGVMTDFPVKLAEYLKNRDENRKTDVILSQIKE